MTDSTTPQWTVDDDGSRLVWDPLIELSEGVWNELESCCGEGSTETDRSAAVAWPALVADVAAARLVPDLEEVARMIPALVVERNLARDEAKAAARLVDDMAAVVRRLDDGWTVVSVESRLFWLNPLTSESEPMSPRKVAALHHARRQEGT